MSQEQYKKETAVKEALLQILSEETELEDQDIRDTLASESLDEYEAEIENVFRL